MEASEETPERPKLSIEAAGGLQNALARIEQARQAVLEAPDDESLQIAGFEYQRTRKDVGPAFAEAQRQFELVEAEYPGA